MYTQMYVLDVVASTLKIKYIVMKNNIYKIGWQQYRIVTAKKNKRKKHTAEEKDQKVKTTFVLYRK